MVKGYTQEHVYKHPWERVTAANWKKFADLEHRPLLPHVVDCTVVSKSLDEDGRLLATRAIVVSIPAPKWLLRLMATNVCRSLEQSVCDNDKRLLELVTHNETLKDFIDVEEKCSYRPHPDNPDWTLFQQQTRITCSSLPALRFVVDKIEQKCAEKFQQNSRKGRQVVESVCRALERAEETTTTTTTATTTADENPTPETCTVESEPVHVTSLGTPQLSSSSSGALTPSKSLMRSIWDRAEIVG